MSRTSRALHPISQLTPIVKRRSQSVTARGPSAAGGAPFGLDLYLGLPEELEPRCEPVRAMNPTRAQAESIAADPVDPASLLAIAFNSNSENKDFTLDIPNTREVRARGQASVGGVGNARGVAGMYPAALPGLGGEPLLRAETIA